MLYTYINYFRRRNILREKADKNIEVLKEAAKYIYIVCCPNITPIPLLICIIVSI